MPHHSSVSPLVSIIVPIYNVAPYLKTCLDSLASQTYPNLEIILVEDGSTDGSAEIADEYSSRNQLARIIHQANRGVSAARNTGLENANGKYILFVDSDDWGAPNLTQSLVEKMESQDAQLTIGDCTIVQDNAERPLFLRKEPFLPGMKLAKEFARVPLTGKPNPLIADLEWGCSWGRLFDREMIESNNLHFDPRLSFQEDSLFMMQYCSKIDRAMTTDEPLYFYRQRKDSAWNRRVLQYDAFEIQRLFYRECFELLKVWPDLNDEERQEALERLHQFYADKICWFLFRFAAYSQDAEILKKIRMLCDQTEFQRALRYYRSRPGQSKTLSLYFRMKEPLLVFRELRRHAAAKSRN